VIEDDVASPGDIEQGDPLFDPREDGIDFYESLEGMLTEVRKAVVVGPTVSFGSGATANKEIPVLADGGAGASVRAPRGPILVRGFDRSAPQEYRRGDFNPERSRSTTRATRTARSCRSPTSVTASPLRYARWSTTASATTSSSRSTTRRSPTAS
jgi:hypothetical protein